MIESEFRRTWAYRHHHMQWFTDHAEGQRVLISTTPVGTNSGHRYSRDGIVVRHNEGTHAGQLGFLPNDWNTQVTRAKNATFYQDHFAFRWWYILAYNEAELLVLRTLGQFEFDEQDVGTLFRGAQRVASSAIHGSLVEYQGEIAILGVDERGRLYLTRDPFGDPSAVYFSALRGHTKIKILALPTMLQRAWERCYEKVPARQAVQDQIEQIDQIYDKENTTVNTRIATVQVIDGTVSQILDETTNTIVWQSEPFQDRPADAKKGVEAATAYELAMKAASDKRTEVLKKLWS